MSELQKGTPIPAGWDLVSEGWVMQGRKYKVVLRHARGVEVEARSANADVAWSEAIKAAAGVPEFVTNG